jgi:hypothetical protein
MDVRLIFQNVGVALIQMFYELRSSRGHNTSILYIHGDLKLAHVLYPSP